MRPATVVAGCMGMCEYVLNVYLWMWSGRYMVVYILPLCLYTKSTPTFIYFVAYLKLGGKEKHEQIPKLITNMVSRHIIRNTKIIIEIHYNSTTKVGDRKMKIAK